LGFTGDAIANLERGGVRDEELSCDRNSGEGRIARKP